MRDEIQRRIVREHLPAPGDKPQGGIGTVGWIDENFVAKRVDNAGMYGKPFKGKAWKRIKLERKTSGPQTWNVRVAQVWLAGDGRPTPRTYWMILHCVQDRQKHADRRDPIFHLHRARRCSR